MSKIIDMECQGVLIGAGRAGGRSTSGKVERFWNDEGRVQFRAATPDTVEKSLEFMDKAGIDIGPIGGLVGGAADLNDIKSLNNACAEIVKKYPKRFVGLAAASLFGGKPAFDEMERAIKDLGMKAFRINARPEGRHLDSRELWPFYEKVSQLGVPLDVHIAGAMDGFDALHAPYALYYIMAREFNQCAETLRICLGGVLEDFPDLVIIMHHFGGGVSAVMERLDVYERMMGDNLYQDKPLISKPWREYFNKLYFSMGGREDIAMASTKCALTTISPDHLMFATDWSPNFEDNPQGVRHYIEEIRELPLPKDDIEGMLGGNAAKVMGI